MPEAVVADTSALIALEKINLVNPVKYREDVMKTKKFNPAILHAIPAGL